jgi:RimJ/RimL family protein N-acetyltransferase
MDPLLFDFPDSFESERLVIRAPRPGDGRAVYDASVETLADLRAFPASLPWAMAEPSVELSESFCGTGHANFIQRKDLPMLLIERGSGSLVGASGLHRFDWSVPKFEIGFWCRRSRQGEGFITEAVNAIAAFAFQTLKARRVEAFSDDLNVRSCRVCERAGFELEGVMRNERVDPNGTLRNTRIYARLG